MIALDCNGMRVDWLKPVLPIYSHILDRATDEPWLNGNVRVASTEGLILLKLLASRRQDLADIENLIAASEGALDLEWIRTEWQSVAPLNDRRMVEFETMLQ